MLGSGLASIRIKGGETAAPSFSGTWPSKFSAGGAMIRGQWLIDDFGDFCCCI